MQLRALRPSIGCWLGCWLGRSLGRSLGPRRGAARWAAAAIGWVLAGCYAAVAPPGAPCATTQGCPDEQQCVAGVCTEAGRLPIDAGAPVPVPLPIDSAPADPPGDAGDPVTCQSSDACTTAKMLGTISGDAGNQTLTASGTRSAWFRVRATEDAMPSDGSMRVLAKLTPPAGEDFDVLVYVDPDTDTVACPNAAGTVTTGGPGKQVPVSWRDFLDDASRTVSIEVRPRSASCSATAKWQLVIEGNATAN
ncbi:MAG TPA: hypothetical protein VHT91_50040 [Kofleriaceae bacterium]|jgi:hypothetical protein|nr:hypothetical protein [Kofleriaceae bacterium]